MGFKYGKWINSRAKKAKNLGKIGVSNGFRYGKWISFRAKKGKKLGKIGVSNDLQSESILLLKKAKNLGKKRGYVIMNFKVSESISLLKRQTFGQNKG